MLKSIEEAWTLVHAKTAQGSVRPEAAPAPAEEWKPGLPVGWEDDDDDAETDLFGNPLGDEPPPAPEAVPVGEWQPAMPEEV